MGADLADTHLASARYAEAEAILGWSVQDVCQRPSNQVSVAPYTQPCLYVIETILTDLLKAKGYRPDVVAGHSLGEFSALYAAGVFDFAAGLRLVKRRAELMSQAAEGTMAALIGFDRDQLDAKIAATDGVVLANDNSPSQVVISGTPAAVTAVIQGIKVKRAVKLNVSGAFHSPLMAEAAERFATLLAETPFKNATVPVLSNADPRPSTDAIVLKARLTEQMTGSVRWREISLQLPPMGVDTVVEVGPGNVLAGLVKHTCKGLTLKNVGTQAQLEAFSLVTLPVLALATAS